MKRASLLSISLLLAFGPVQSALAVDYPLPPAGSRLVGQNQTYTVQASDRNIQAVARHFDTAAMVVIEANNAIAPVPAPGTAITIPSQLILPDTPREGIVINLAELRLYYYPLGANIVQVFPIGIGQQGLETPVTTTRITQKIPNPTWTPTAGIRQRSKAKGVELPEVVPAGPRNPLGRFAMRLGIGHGEYLIHGTNAPDSVGLRVSSGYIRMNAENIKTQFSEASVGTPVAIINQPVKYSVEADGRRYIEVHRPMAQQEQQNTQTLPIAFDSMMTTQISDSGGDRLAINNALNRRAGYPVMNPAAANVATPGTTV